MARFKYIHDLVVCRGAEASAPECAGEGKDDLSTRFEFFVHKEYEYEYDGQRHAVPTGTPTDFASVWGPLRSFLPRVGYHTEAALVHDYLYRQDDGSDPNDQKKRADDIFLAAMEETKMCGFTQWLAYAAVASLGHRAFNDGRTEKARVQRDELGQGIAFGMTGLVLFPGLAAFSVVATAVAGALPFVMIGRYIYGKIAGS